MEESQTGSLTVQFTLRLLNYIISSITLQLRGTSDVLVARSVLNVMILCSLLLACKQQYSRALAGPGISSACVRVSVWA